MSQPTLSVEGRWLEVSCDFSTSSFGTLVLVLKSSHLEADEQMRRKVVGKGGTWSCATLPSGERRFCASGFQQVSRDHMESIFCSQKPHSHYSHSLSHSRLESRCCRSHSPRCTPGDSRSCPSSILGRQNQRSRCSTWCWERKA